MRKALGVRILSIIVFLILAHCLHAQVYYPANKNIAPTTIKSPSSKSSKPTTVSPKSNSKLVLKITTDSDCTLFIDDDNKGILKKGEIIKVSLPIGEYRIMAVSKGNKKDIFSENYMVSETGNERIYEIPLLKVIDERNQKEINEKKQAELNKIAEEKNKMHAIKSRLVTELNKSKEYNADTIKKYINLGADVNIKNQTGLTALMIASNKNDANLCKFLFSKGATIDIFSNDGKTAFYYASIHDSRELTKLFIEQGLNQNIKSTFEFYSNRDPLAICIKLNAAISLETLFDNGFDVNSKSICRVISNYGIPPDDLFINYEGEFSRPAGHYQSEPSATLLHYAALCNSLNTAHLLMKKGINVNAKDFFNNTPLHYAMDHRSECDTGMLKSLILNGADINAINSNYGDSPLHIVCFNADKLNTLIEKGANINLKSLTGYTPLFIYIREYCNYAYDDTNPSKYQVLEIINLLLKKGSRVDIMNSQGETPITYLKNHIKNMKRYGFKSYEIEVYKRILTLLLSYEK